MGAKKNIFSLNIDAVRNGYIDMKTLNKKYQELLNANRDKPAEEIRLIHALSEGLSELRVSKLLSHLMQLTNKTIDLKNTLKGVDTYIDPYNPMHKSKAQKLLEEAAEDRELSGIRCLIKIPPRPNLSIQ